MKSYKNLMAGIMATALALTGCGGGSTGSAQIPSLVEPVAVTSAFRPVEKGNIGAIEVQYAVVAAEEYPYFYGTDVTLSEIAVEAGDEVKAGDVLAYADITSANETLAALQKELETENEIYAINNKITEQQILEIGYRQERIEAAKQQEPEDTATEETGEEGVAGDVVEEDYAAEIATLRENQRYDGLLHEFRVQRLEEAIAAEEETIAQGTLLADRDGTVTYAKSLSGSASVSANEAVVVVSDTASLYLETFIDVETYETEYGYGDYEVKYLLADGERYDVEEIPYTQEELMLAKMQEQYPNVRLTFPEDSGYRLGDTCPVCYIEKDVSDVLVVANDSIYSDGEHSFVYVRTEENEKEKRVIETGASDDNYTQVISGLSEGEWVFFDCDSAIPSGYSEFTVELSDFSCYLVLNGSYYLSDSVSFFCTSTLEGELVEVDVEEGDEVKEGDLLYIVDTGQGAAALSDTQMQIKRQQASYDMGLKSYEEQEKIVRESEELSFREKQCELLILEYRKQLFIVSQEQVMEALSEAYEEQNRGNDGTGKVSVYAEYSGTVSNLSAEFSEGEQLKAGQVLFFYRQQAKDKLLVRVESGKVQSTVGPFGQMHNPAAVGAGIRIRTGETEFAGSSSGIVSNGTGKIYSGTRNGEAYFSFRPDSGSGSPSFYVKMEEDSFYENMEEEGTLSFSYMRVKGAAAVPSDMIYQEEIAGKMTRNYVWKLVEEEPVKQYVVPLEEPNADSEKVILYGVNAGDVLVREAK